MRLTCVLIASLLLSLLAFGQSKTPERDYVPDEKTAVAIGEAVLIPVYGEAHIKSERPFHAMLENDVWLVTGTLHCPKGLLCDGGMATVRISKKDGRILEMIHYK